MPDCNHDTQTKFTCTGLHQELQIGKEKANQGNFSCKETTTISVKKKEKERKNETNKQIGE